MPSHELDGYIMAANKMEKAEVKDDGLNGQRAIDAAQHDPAIRINDGNTG